MSIAHAVAHGAFGRACLYELDRPMVPHAHREGHLIFHVSGPVASVVVDGKTLPLTPGARRQSAHGNRIISRRSTAGNQR